MIEKMLSVVPVENQEDTDERERQRSHDGDRLSEARKLR
jgi:hypothetical protein